MTPSQKSAFLDHLSSKQPNALYRTVINIVNEASSLEELEAMLWEKQKATAYVKRRLTWACFWARKELYEYFPGQDWQRNISLDSRKAK